jgi:preprotein translocase subunit YajC
LYWAVTSGKRCPRSFSPVRGLSPGWGGEQTTVHYAFALLAQAGGPQSYMTTVVFFGGMIAIMYFLMIRPQQKQLKDHKALLAGLKKGDAVITQGGIIGKIAEISEREVKLEVAQGMKIRVLKSAIQTVTPNTEAPKAEDKKEEK